MIRRLLYYMNGSRYELGLKNFKEIQKACFGISKNGFLSCGNCYRLSQFLPAA